MKRNVVYRSEHIPEHLNPYWNEFCLSAEHLCYCDPEWPLRLAVLDYQPRSGKHRTIGYVETTLLGLQQRRAKCGNADRIIAFEIVAADVDFYNDSGGGGGGGGSVGNSGNGGGSGSPNRNNTRVVVADQNLNSNESQSPVGLIVVLRVDVDPKLPLPPLPPPVQPPLQPVSESSSV